MTKTTKKTSVSLYPEIGQRIFVRTVTHHYTGRVVAADKAFVALDRAAWIADDGRFADAMAAGSVSEVEPYPDAMVVRVGLNAVVDWCEWPHDLPRKQK